MTEPIRDDPPPVNVPGPEIATPPPDYITRTEFDRCIDGLRDDLKAHIDSALKDMREMLRQSLKANSDQRDMITTTLSSIQATITEMVAARDATITEIRSDVNDLQKTGTQLQLALAMLATQTATTTENLNRFILKVDQYNATAINRAAQLETRIEENFTWIERRRKIERATASLLRPVLQLPRWAKLAALTTIALGGTQYQLDWLDYLMDLFR